MSAISRSRLVLVAAGLLTLTSCMQLSVTGPCEVQSDSSITLDLDWGGSTVVTASLRESQSAPAPGVAGRPASGPSRVTRNAENDSVTILVEYPEGWTFTSVEGQIEGGPATITDSTAPEYCDVEDFGAPRDGYDRIYFKVSNGSPLEDDATGELHVSFETGHVAPGVYHPMFGIAFEPSSPGSCTAGLAFHRVSSGSPTFTQFDMSSLYNSDVVVNEGDTAQDPLFVATSTSGPTANLAFITEGAAEHPFSLPDDGLLTPERAEAQWSFWMSEMGAPLLIDMPECFPPVQMGFRNDQDGDNAWMAMPGDESMSLDVPPRVYSEILLFVTAGADVASTSDPENFVNMMHVTLTYSDGTTDEIDGLVPIFGLPFAFGATEFAPVLPTYSFGFSTLVQTDGSAPPPSSGPFATGQLPTGIAAVAVSPDPTRQLVNVEVSHLPVEGLEPAAGGVQSDQDPTTGDSFAVWAVAGAAAGALPADVPTTSQWALLILGAAIGIAALIRVRS